MPAGGQTLGRGQGLEIAVKFVGVLARGHVKLLRAAACRCGFNESQRLIHFGA